MSYSKTTDEIVRELNNFIAKAKETAELARKNGVSTSLPQPFSGQFWNNIAGKTDNYTRKLEDVLEYISNINDHPDEITNRFNILKAIDDVMFISKIMDFHVGLTIARSLPDVLTVLKPISEKYTELANLSEMKIYKIRQFFNDLSVLIFEDMRKISAEKIADAAKKAGIAAGMIQGYDYIKCEIVYMAEKLESVSTGDITAEWLENYLFRLSIIQFSVDTDILRSGGMDKAMFEGIEPFRQSLSDAYDFFRTLPVPAKEEYSDINITKVLQDIAYQGNILLFYTRGEIEKIRGFRLEENSFVNNEQKAALDKICDKINSFIRLAHNSAGGTAFKPIADLVHGVQTDMADIADSLGEKGGAFRFMSNEFGIFYNKIMGCVRSAGAG